MYTFNTQRLSQSAIYALTASVTILSLLFVGFFFAEPTISRAQAVDTTPNFTVTQLITDETAFLIDPSNVTTSGSISGVTGGVASGTTEFSVISNNSTGYRVEMTFEDNSVGGISTMIGDTDGDEAIRDYGPAGGLAAPEWGYTASSAAQFAYTVTSLNPAHTADAFLNDTSSCGAGSFQNGTSSSTKCWMSPGVANYEIVNNDGAAVTGATSTLEFNITVPSGANPQPTAQSYTATATLSLFTQ